MGGRRKGRVQKAPSCNPNISAASVYTMRFTLLTCSRSVERQSAKRGDKESQPQESTPQNPRTPAGAGTRGSLAGVTAANSGTGGGAPGSARLAAAVVVGSAGPAIGIGSSSRVFNPVSSAEPYFRPFNVTPSSASQFVLNEASRGSPSPHLVHQSPVLDTEELYRAAGWMTPLPNESGGGAGGSGGAGSANGGVDAENGGRGDGGVFVADDRLLCLDFTRQALNASSVVEIVKKMNHREPTTYILYADRRLFIILRFQTMYGPSDHKKKRTLGLDTCCIGV